MPRTTRTLMIRYYYPGPQTAVVPVEIPDDLDDITDEEEIEQIIDESGPIIKVNHTMWEWERASGKEL